MAGLRYYETSRDYKEEGNKALMKGDQCRALILYNMAICYARSNETRALAYANRSAVYLESGLYDECLQNIQWARENKYPDHKIHKLNEREEKAKRLKAAHVRDPVDDPWNFIKLSHPPNPKIPFIVDCLEMKKTEKFGRGIYATRDISTGDILSIEESLIQYMKHIDVEENHYRCVNCGKSNFFNLIPCLKTRYFMFCTTECRSKFYKKMVDLSSVQFPMRKVYGDIKEKFGSRQSLLEFLKNVPDITALNYSVFDFDWNNPNDPEYGINQIKCFLSLKIPIDMVEDIIRNGGNPVEPLTGPFCVTKGSKCIEELIELAMNKSSLDAMRYSNQPVITSNFVNLINHSCDSNVQRIQIANKVVLYATRPIKAGDQLFESFQMDTWICHYHEKETVPRRELVEKVFKFTCDCIVCTMDLDESKSRFFDRAAVDMLSLSTIEALKDDSLKPAIDQWKINNEFITQHHENRLSKDVHVAKKLNLKIIEKIAYAANFRI